MDIVGQIGGVSWAVAADAADPTIAYLGLGPRVVAFDIRGDDTPQPIGRSPVLTAVVTDLVVSAGFGYVATEAGLGVLDLSDPTAPSLVDEHLLWPWTPEIGWDYRAPRLSLAGRWLLLTSGIEDDPAPLHAFDVQDPARPRAIAPLPIVETRYAYVSDVVAWGDRAVVQLGGEAASQSTLTVFDLPAEGPPRLLGLHRLPAPVHAIALEGRELWISDELCALRRSHIDDAGAIEDRSCIRTATSPAERIAVQDGLAALAFGTSLWLLDGTRPDVSVFLGEVPAWATALQGLDGGLRWLAATASGGLQVIDLDPGQPPAARSGLQLDDPGLTYRPRQMLQQDDRLWLALLGGLAAIDLAAPDGPRLTDLDTYHAGAAPLAGGEGWIAVADERTLVGVDIMAATPDGRIEALAHIAMEGRPLDLAASGDRLVILGDPRVLGSGPDDRRFLEVFDLQDPRAPVKLGRQPIRTARRIEAAEGRVYTSGGGFVDVFAIDGPEVPSFLGSLSRSGSGCAGPHQGFLYCEHPREDIEIVDVRDPTDPKPAAGAQFEAALDSSCPHPQIAAGMLYCGFDSKQDGGWRYDLSDPFRPRLAGHFGGFGHLHAVAGTGGPVLLLSSAVLQEESALTLDLHLIDPGTPAHLSPARPWRSLAQPWNLAVEGSRAYLTVRAATQTWMLATVDTTDASRPELLAQQPLDFDPRPIAADGTMVYLAKSWPPRIHIFDLRDPFAPQELPAIELESWPYAMAAAEGQLWLAGEDGLRGYAIDPRTGRSEALGHLPSRRALHDHPVGGMDGLLLRGSTAFVTDDLASARQSPTESAQIHAVDLRDPRNLRITATYTLPGLAYTPRSLAWGSGRLIAETNDREQRRDGLWFIDPSAPNPRLESVWYPGGAARRWTFDLAWHDGHAFVALSDGAIAVLGTELEPEPRLLDEIVLPGGVQNAIAMAEDGTLWVSDWKAGLLALRFDEHRLPSPTPGATPTRRPLPSPEPSPSATSTGRPPLHLPMLQR